jgi:hypothetical protein
MADTNPARAFGLARAPEETSQYPAFLAGQSCDMKRERELVARSAGRKVSLDSPVGLRPLAQRILDDLPGPPMLWTAAWALAPWLNAGANLLLDTGERSAVWEQGRAVVIVNYATLSFAILVVRSTPGRSLKGPGLGSSESRPVPSRWCALD